jgi:hypothetical protein
VTKGKFIGFKIPIESHSQHVESMEEVQNRREQGNEEHEVNINAKKPVKQFRTCGA